MTPAGEGAPAEQAPDGGDGSGRPARHAATVRLLLGWAAPDEEQDALRREYLDLLASHADALERSCTPAHLTASALVLDHDARRVLLVHHGRIHQWVQAGGHVESGDPDLAACALREAVEETGVPDLRLDPDPMALSRHPAPCRSGADWHYDVQFLARADARAVPVVSAESHDVSWFPVDDLPVDLASGVQTLVAAAVARSAAPAAPATPS